MSGLACAVTAAQDWRAVLRRARSQGGRRVRGCLSRRPSGFTSRPPRRWFLGLPHITSRIPQVPPDFRRRCGWSWGMSPQSSPGGEACKRGRLAQLARSAGSYSGPALFHCPGSHPLFTARGDRGPGVEALRRWPWCRGAAANDETCPAREIVEGGREPVSPVASRVPKHTYR